MYTVEKTDPNEVILLAGGIDTIMFNCLFIFQFLFRLSYCTLINCDPTVERWD
jgi:hypothetical protein